MMYFKITITGKGFVEVVHQMAPNLKDCMDMVTAKYDPQDSYLDFSTFTNISFSAISEEDYNKTRG